MTHLHLQIERAEDLTLLLPLLNRLGIHWEESQGLSQEPIAEDRGQWLKIVEAGGDGLSFGDIMAWQRKERQDRPLPGRE